MNGEVLQLLAGLEWDLLSVMRHKALLFSQNIGNAYLGVILAHAAILVSSDDVLIHVAPASHGRLALVADDGQLLLVALLAVDVGVDVENDDGAQMTHALLGDAQQLGSLLVKLDALDGGGELPGLEQATSLDLPEADCVVGTAAGNHA